MGWRARPARQRYPPPAEWPTDVRLRPVTAPTVALGPFFPRWAVQTSRFQFSNSPCSSRSTTAQPSPNPWRSPTNRCGALPVGGRRIFADSLNNSMYRTEPTTTSVVDAPRWAPSAVRPTWPFQKATQALLSCCSSPLLTLLGPTLGASDCQPRPGQPLTCTAGTRRSNLPWRGAALFPVDARMGTKQIYLELQR